jgi:hypothetical protein
LAKLIGGTVLFAPSMLNRVDGKASEGGARLGAIGRDHLGEIGHEFGRDYQLRHNGPARVGVVVHDEDKPPEESKPD